MKKEEILKEMDFEDLKKKLVKEEFVTTSALLAVKNLDGTYLCSTAFLEGEPEGLGVQLYTNYNDELKARHLISLGDFYKLGSTLTPPKETINETFYPESIDYTIFFDRDMEIKESSMLGKIAGEDLFKHSIGCIPKLYDEIAILERANKIQRFFNPCYIYVFENNSWSCFYNTRYLGRKACIFNEDDVRTARKNSVDLEKIALEQKGVPSNYEETVINMVWKNLNLKVETCYLSMNYLKPLYDSDGIAYLEDNGNTVVFEGSFIEDDKKREEKLSRTRKNLEVRSCIVISCCQYFKFKDFSSKKSFYLLGKRYELQTKTVASTKEVDLFGQIKFKNNKMILRTQNKKPSNMEKYTAFKKFYIEFLGDYMPKKIDVLGEDLNVSSKDYNMLLVPLNMNDMLGCVSIDYELKSDISFFWRLACCSEHTIERIILHELIHLKHNKELKKYIDDNYIPPCYWDKYTASKFDSHDEEFYSYYSEFFPEFEDLEKERALFNKRKKQMYL